MFDNPEKLFIILLIALFIFGPQKLIGLGSSMGKAIREFRSHVRDAQEQFHAAVAEAQPPEESVTASEPLALPAPDPIVPALPATPEPIQAAQPTASAPDAGAGVPAVAPDPASSTSPAAEAAEDEGPHSLASEPSSQAVWEILQRKT
jgi:sec-independent protein translocase protein TatA